MAETLAMLVDQVAGSSASIDGQHIIINFKMADGTIINFALMPNVVVNLMSLSAAAVGQAARNRSSDVNTKYVLPVDWWEIAKVVEDGSIIMTYKLPGGLEMTFRLFPDGAHHMHQVLGEVLGVSRTTLPLGIKAN